MIPARTQAEFFRWRRWTGVMRWAGDVEIAQMPNDTPASQHVFHRLGFEAVTVLPGFALGPVGELRDLLLMSRDEVGLGA